MRNEFIAVRLSPTEKKLLVRNAKRLGCPMSDFIRTGLRLMFQGVIVIPKPAADELREAQ
jgi:hypothetical protein